MLPNTKLGQPSRESYVCPIQNCALEREVMNDEFEKKMKDINNMSHLRKASTKMTGLKEAFNESMQPVINTVNARFESMKLKDDRIKCKQPASEEAVQQFKDSIHLLDSEVDLSKLQASDVKTYVNLTL